MEVLSSKTGADLRSLEINQVDRGRFRSEDGECGVGVPPMVRLMIEEIAQCGCKALGNGSYIGNGHIGEASGKSVFFKAFDPVYDALVFTFPGNAQGRQR